MYYLFEMVIKSKQIVIIEIAVVYQRRKYTATPWDYSMRGTWLTLLKSNKIANNENIFIVHAYFKMCVLIIVHRCVTINFY